jgi:hypothetical protein
MCRFDRYDGTWVKRELKIKIWAMKNL